MGKIRKKFTDEEKKSFLVAQDVKLVRALASNDSKIRDRVLKNLKRWFDQRSVKMPFAKEDFLRIWKGLFYTMWMSDKPLIQEECAEKISGLLHFPNPQDSLLFFRCALDVMRTEWFGIDQLRMDKFLMFVRRILRQAFEVLKRNDWNMELVTNFGDILLETVLNDDHGTHLSLTMHITEIYLEELAKVSNGELEEILVLEFLKPFIKQLSTLTDNRQIAHMRKFLFHHLLHQSDIGVEYNEKFEAWKERGFPGGTIDSMQQIAAEEDGSDNDEELESRPLDPRAGHVDVVLPRLEFDPEELCKLLLANKFNEGSTARTRKIITKLAQEFKKLAHGNFPLGIKEIRLPDNDGYSTSLKKSVNRLVKFEKKLLSDSSQNRKRKRKNKKVDLDSGKNLQPDSTDLFENKLEEFIQKSEAGLVNGGSPPQKRKLKSHKKNTDILSSTPNWKYEDHFRRNSGLWVVHRSKGDEKEDTNSSFTITNTPIKNTKIIDDNEIGNDETSSKQSVFPQTEWDMPPKEGEVEIFVPSNTYKQKMKKMGEKSGKNITDLLSKSLNGLLQEYSDASKNLIQQRHSLDAYLVKNPFSQNGKLPASEKKVKIDLKLNKSQEIHEHQAQIRSSPAIPYDATRKPSKPMLKANGVQSPINPFYKKKLKLR